MSTSLAAKPPEWIDRTVPGQTVGALTLDQWIVEFMRLKKLNAVVLKGKATRKRA